MLTEAAGKNPRIDKAARMAADPKLTILIAMKSFDFSKCAAQNTALQASGKTKAKLKRNHY